MSLVQLTPFRPAGSYAHEDYLTILKSSDSRPVDLHPLPGCRHAEIAPSGESARDRPVRDDSLCD